MGIRSAATTEARAQLALAEMQRVGAFDRSVLVIISRWVPDGSIRPASMRSSTCSTATWRAYRCSIPTSPAHCRSSSSRTTAPKPRRPCSTRSTGIGPPCPMTPARGSISTASASARTPRRHRRNSFDVMGDPFDGALWVGPPLAADLGVGHAQPAAGLAGVAASFRRQFQRSLRQSRQRACRTRVPWGPMRIAFLQYASDPIVFFGVASLIASRIG